MISLEDFVARRQAEELDLFFFLVVSFHGGDELPATSLSVSCKCRATA